MGRASKDPADFCLIDSPPEHRLSNFERLTLVGGRELERALNLVAEQLKKYSLNGVVRTFDLDALREAAAFYGQDSFRDDPAQFFIAPDSPPEAQVALVHGLPDGEVIDLSFPSRYQAAYVQAEEMFRHFKENATVYARMWRHKKRARATLVAIHGWSMGDPRINSIAFLPGLLYKLGIDVVLFELPFHGRRAPQTLAHGELFPATDIFLTNEAMGQVVHDLRSLRSYLGQQGHLHVGWAGVSLGAYVGALWSGLDNLDFAVAMVPMSSMAESMWGLLARDPEFRDLKKRGLTVELVRRAVYVHSPLAHCLKLDPARALIIGGLGDKLVSPAQVKMLAAHWRGAKLKWFRGGHGAALNPQKAFRLICRFLNALSPRARVDLPLRSE